MMCSSENDRVRNDLHLSNSISVQAQKHVIYGIRLPNEAQNKMLIWDYYISSGTGYDLSLISRLASKWISSGEEGKKGLCDIYVGSKYPNKIPSINPIMNAPMSPKKPDRFGCVSSCFRVSI
jgi:hypothetical protein